MSDLINRQAAIDALRAMQTYKMFAGDDLLLIDQAGAQTELMMLPSTQSKTNCSEFPNNSDAISRQAAIDSMCELMRHWFGCDSKDEIREIKRELGKLPSAQPEQRWIPCSERLPDIKEHHCSEPCIVYCENGAYGFAELEENIFGQVGWNCERDDEYHEPLGKVLAWMPLPEPYQGGETDETD